MLQCQPQLTLGFVFFARGGFITLLLWSTLFQFSDEADSDSAQSRVMAELEEDTPEEADVTVSPRPPSRKTQTNTPLSASCASQAGEAA